MFQPREASGCGVVSAATFRTLVGPGSSAVVAGFSSTVFVGLSDFPRVCAPGLIGRNNFLASLELHFGKTYLHRPGVFLFLSCSRLVVHFFVVFAGFVAAFKIFFFSWPSCGREFIFC